MSNKTNSKNADQMKNFIKGNKSSSTKSAFSSVTNKQDKKFTTHRKLGK